MLTMTLKGRHIPLTAFYFATVSKSIIKIHHLYTEMLCLSKKGNNFWFKLSGVRKIESS